MDEIRPQFSLDAPDANTLFASSIVRNNGMSIGDTIDKLDTQVSDIYGLHTLALPSYSDQVLPFDVTLAGANEYGAMCAAKILGVEILNEGSGISVDDAEAGTWATCVARAVEPMQTWSLRPAGHNTPRACARARTSTRAESVGEAGREGS